MIVAGLMALAGCASMKPAPPVKLYMPFDAAQAAALSGPGDSTIRGSAFFRQQGGGTVTCAGEMVLLIPLTQYATERVQALYGGLERGYRPWYMPPINFEPAYPEYLTTARKANCDALGFFNFEKVKAGEYYITTRIVWQAGNASQGGSLMQKVRVQSGERLEVVVAP